MHGYVARQIRNIHTSFGVYSCFLEKLKETNVALNQKNNGRHFYSRTDLVRTLKQDIQPGDVVLLKGSRGMAMEKILEGVF